MKQLKPNQIKYLKANINYTQIFYIDNTKVLSSYSLTKFQKRLPDFIRVTKSYLVNPEYLKVQYPYFIVDNFKIKIPRRKLKQFKQ